MFEGNFFGTRYFVLHRLEGAKQRNRSTEKQINRKRGFTRRREARKGFEGGLGLFQESIVRREDFWGGLSFFVWLGILVAEHSQRLGALGEREKRGRGVSRRARRAAESLRERLKGNIQNDRLSCS